MTSSFLSIQKCISNLSRYKTKSSRINKYYNLTQVGSIGFVISGAIIASTGITISTFTSSGLAIPLITATFGITGLTFGTISSFGSKIFIRQKQKEILNNVQNELDKLISKLIENNKDILNQVSSIRASLVKDNIDFNHLNGGSAIYSKIFFIISENCSQEHLRAINIISETHPLLLNFIDECKQFLLKYLLDSFEIYTKYKLIAVYLMFETWSLCHIILFKEENKLPKKIQEIIDILKNILKLL